MTCYLRSRCLYNLHNFGRKMLERSCRRISGAISTQIQNRGIGDSFKTQYQKQQTTCKTTFRERLLSDTAQILYRSLRKNKVLRGKSPRHFKQLYSFETWERSDAYNNVLEIMQNSLGVVHNVTQTHNSFYHGKKSFQVNCETMDNQELVSLVYYLTYESGYQYTAHSFMSAEELWSPRHGKLFNCLEKELRQRLYSCFQHDHDDESFAVFENALHMMLNRKVGFSLFQTFVSYCIYRSNSAVTLDNLPLLLLSMYRTQYASLSAFQFLEDFASKHFSHLDFPIISLFCVTFFVCNMQISSGELLSEIGARLLQHLQETNNSDIEVNSVVNILKILRHSGYVKNSFYSQLENLLSNHDFVIKCNPSQAMHILKTFETFSIYPSKLLEPLTKGLKYFIITLKERNYSIFRLKDIGSYIKMLGIYQFCDKEEADIFYVCSDVILQQLHTGRSSESAKYTAMYLMNYAIGMLYAGKFNDAIIDALHRIPNVVDLLEETNLTELLILHYSIQIEYPQYKGKQLSEKNVDYLQNKLDSNWTIDMEMDVSSDLKEQVDILRYIVGSDKMEVGYILPYLRSADITLFLDANDRLVQSRFAKKRVAVEVVGWGQCVRGTDKLLGKYVLKLRHLEKLGYKTIVVGPQERYHVRQYGSRQEKKDFWVGKLQDSGISITSK